MPRPPLDSAVLGLLSAVLALASCAPPPSSTPGEELATERDTGVIVASSSSTATPRSRDEAVLARLPDCTDDERPAVPFDVPGLVLPPDARVVDVVEDDPLVTVEALVPLNPIDVRRFYEFQNLGVLKTLMIEDEILEAEALLESRTHRMFVKAQATCRDASVVYVVVAEGGSDARLPQPGDTNAPGAPPATTTP